VIPLNIIPKPCNQPFDLGIASNTSKRLRKSED
jgi:hypothetical protein